MIAAIGTDWYFNLQTNETNYRCDLTFAAIEICKLIPTGAGTRIAVASNLARVVLAATF